MSSLVRNRLAADRRICLRRLLRSLCAGLPTDEASRGSLLPRHQQQQGAEHHGAHAGPHRDMGPALALHRELHGTELRLMVRLGIVETAVYQAEETCGHEQDGDDLEYFHVASS